MSTESIVRLDRLWDCTVWQEVHLTERFKWAKYLIRPDGSSDKQVILNQLV